MKILVVTNMYPSVDNQASGTFVKDQVEELRRLGNGVEVLQIRGDRSKWNYIRAIVQVLFRTIQSSYDIVHAHYGLSGFASLLRWKTPLVITLHGSDILVGRIQPLISRIAARFADKVVVVSEQIARKVNGVLIPCGVDFALFHSYDKEMARKELGLPAKRKLVLFPFDPTRVVKRYDIAKAVVENLALRGYDIELLAVSGKNHDEMPLYYSASDAMLLCSDSEGSPTSVKEAIACNLPVVSADVGDVRQILRDAHNCCICSQNVNALKAGLERVLTECRTPSCNSNSTLERYNSHIIARSLVEVYEDVLRQRGCRI